MATSSDRSFGALLRKYRLSAGLSQESLAERARMSARGVSDLERGIHKAPYRETLLQLMEALGLDAEQRATLEAAGRSRGRSQTAAPKPPANSPHNLVEEATSFIGRVEEIAHILELLERSEVRLITLTGPGGSGKTRLALRVAATALDSFPDGVFLVSLGALADPALVASTVSAALGLYEEDKANVVTGLKLHLRDKRTLLVLDSFEHLLDASALLPELLEDCPGLRLMVTSRAVLRLSWERVFAVAPLTVPDPPHTGDPQVSSHYEGVALFAERARSANSKFQVTNDNAAAVAEICYRLDGLPLAIELAAARIRLFPPQALLARLSSRLRVLVGGARDQPTRQQTLRATIDWSYSLLDEAEQKLFIRLAVFAGGCALEAAEAVCAFGDDAMDLLDAIESLVDKSLVWQGRATDHTEPRLRMLETIREYALELLAEADDAETIRRRHADYFVAWAEQAAAELAGPACADWLARLEDERDNLRTALRWACDHGEAKLALRLALALNPFWESRGHLAEGRRWLGELLALDADTTNGSRAQILLVAGNRAFAPDLAHAADFTDEAIALYRQYGDSRGTAEALYQRGVIAFYQADYERAVACLEESKALAQDIGDTDLVGRSLWSLSEPDAATSSASDAKRAAEEDLELSRRGHDAQGIGAALELLLYIARAETDVSRMRVLFKDIVALLHEPSLEPDGQLRERLQRLAFEMSTVGDYGLGTTLLEEGITLNERKGNRRDAAHLRTTLAQFAREQGDYDRAQDLLVASLAVLREIDDLTGITIALIGLGDVGRDRGDGETAAAYSQQGLESARRNGDTLLNGYALHNLGCAAWLQGERDNADRFFSAALEALSLIVEGRAEVLASIGLTALDRGDIGQARSAFCASLTTIRIGDLPWLVALNLEGLAGVEAADGNAEQAARIFGAAFALRRAGGTPIHQAHKALHQRMTAVVREALGEPRFAELHELGSTMTAKAAVTEALGGPGRTLDTNGGERLWRGFRV
ncbi:MAG TPA: helix-turn-helix domain-containing protein [Pseudonocardiaceae bacterium]